MKIVITALTTVVLVVAAAEPNFSPTNHVWIGNRDLCFSISDETADKGDKTRFFDREIFSDVPLFWILHNPTTNTANTHSLGVQRTFALKLFDSQGREIPLTEYGSSMNLGPKTSRSGSESVHFFSLSPDQVDVRDFPIIDRLFQIPATGNYLLEVRFWYRDKSLKQWQRSDPVRLKVIKRQSDH